MSIRTSKAAIPKEQSTIGKHSVKKKEHVPGLGVQDNRRETVIQQKMQEIADNSPQSQLIHRFQQEKENKTGIPAPLKAGIESLSGYSLDDVKVHYNSGSPAQLQAHAYAQGTDIHIAPGQEKHLPHEAWHVVQQKQGRVSATKQLKGQVAINDDAGLEQEADEQGKHALRMKPVPGITAGDNEKENPVVQQKGTIQRMVAIGSYEKVYLPESLRPADPKRVEKTARMTEAINTLSKRNDELVFTNANALEEVITKKIGEKTEEQLRKKYESKVDAERLMSEAAINQQDRTLDTEGRKAIAEKLALDLEAKYNQTLKRKLAILREFSKPRDLYLYYNEFALDNPYTDPEEIKLIAPSDMLDSPGTLEETINEHDICAIETISDFEGDVSDMWNDRDSSTKVEDWHTACKDNGLDYRNDNDYIKILKKLSYTLVRNESVIYNQIDWASSELGDGDYFLATGGGDIGHAIGVTVAGGVVTRVYDRQRLHRDNVNVKYIFKK